MNTKTSATQHNRQPQQFDEREAMKRIMVDVNLLMFYANQGKVIPGHALEKIRQTQKEIEEKLNGNDRKHRQ